MHGSDLRPELTRPDSQFGDFATNIAMRLASQAGQNPRQLAEAIAEKLRSNPDLAEVSVAGPGFINLKVQGQVLTAELDNILQAGENYGRRQDLAGQTVVAEYSDPNPFKILHAGHLYTSIVGEAIANLFEANGATVHRVNFGGDVGMHAAKTMWAILNFLAGENPDGLNTIPVEQRPQWLADRYIEGNIAYEENPEIKPQVQSLNQRLYAISGQNDRDTPLAKIYWTTRQWSYEYFEEFYRRIGSKFEKYYPESEVADLGLQTVKEHIGSVFTESDGAVIFRGDNFGLHARVFINSEGLPTYEAKDVGLILKKYEDYHFDKSIVITGNEQAQYMAVVLKAVEQFKPQLVQATRHITHGLVKLAGGQKMSSRKGNILKATDVLDTAAEANRAASGSHDELVTLGAVKYSFLKHRIGADIIYDPKESVSIHGNSGPYLQYALVRAKNILAKAPGGEGGPAVGELDAAERSLVFKLTAYPEVISLATAELMPHHVANYLYELAQVFNQFYETNQVIGSEKQAFRLRLVKAYAQTLSNGLGLLGIQNPDRM